MVFNSHSSIDIRFLRNFVLDSFIETLSLSRRNPLRVLLRPFLFAPAHLFSRLGANFDNYVAENGFKRAANWLLPRFVERIELSGYEKVPTHGALIVACNHPGNIDALSFAASLPRDDLKILALDIPFVQHLPHTSKHFIYSTADDASTHRMLAVRASIRHLRAGGSLLILPAGRIGPDPAVLPGAERNIEKWSPSIKFFLRKVPAARLQLAMLSHVTLPRFFDHPIPRSRKSGVPRQILAQYLQVAYQIVRPRRHFLRPKLSFATPLSLPDLQKKSHTHQAIISQAQSLLRHHVERYSGSI